MTNGVSTPPNFVSERDGQAQTSLAPDQFDNGNIAATNMMLAITGELGHGSRSREGRQSQGTRIVNMATPISQHNPAVIIPIQFLRWVAASFVIIVHLLDRLTKRGAFPQELPLWTSCFGEIGVATFFTISGFVMSYTTQREFGSPDAGKRFFLRRLSRIAPLYYLTSMFEVFFSFFTFRWSTNNFYNQPSPIELFYSFLFIPYINTNGLAQPFYSLGWTLEYEMFFYMIFSLFMKLKKNIGHGILILLLISITIVGYFIPKPSPVEGNVVVIYYFTRPYLIYFVSGMLIATMRNRGIQMRISWSAWLPCCVGLLIMIFGVRFATLGVTPTSVAIATGAVAAAALIIPEKIGPKFFYMGAKTLGDASYSLYLIHSFLLGAIARLGTPFVMRGVDWLIVVTGLACAACSVCAWIVWHHIERPLMRAFSAALSNRDTRPVSNR